MIASTYKLFLVLDRQCSVRQEKAEIDLVLILEACLLKRNLPLLGERSSRIVLLKHSDLLARLLECVQACLELLLVLLWVLATDENLNRDLATLQRL
jgi:hypothetical protein